MRCKFYMVSLIVQYFQEAIGSLYRLNRLNGDDQSNDLKPVSAIDFPFFFFIQGSKGVECQVVKW